MQGHDSRPAQPPVCRHGGAHEDVTSQFHLRRQTSLPYGRRSTLDHPHSFVVESEPGVSLRRLFLGSPLIRRVVRSSLVGPDSRAPESLPTPRDTQEGLTGQFGRSLGRPDPPGLGMYGTGVEREPVDLVPLGLGSTRVLSERTLTSQPFRGETSDVLCPWTTQTLVRLLNSFPFSITFSVILSRLSSCGSFSLPALDQLFRW